MLRKFSGFLLLAVLATSVTFAQQRVLLGPSDDAILLGQGQSAVKQIAKEVNKPEGVLQVCPTGVRLGASEPTTVNFGFFHGDMSAMIYTTPIAGKIESVYFMSYGAVGIPDSSCAVRIMRANMRGSGNATTGGQHHGAWTDSTELDVFRTPYEDEATGPYLPGAHSGVSPAGLAELWGLGGFPSTWHTGATITAMATLDLGYEPDVAAGDSFIICIRLPEAHLTGDRTEMSGGPVLVEPRRFFKYYHHDRSTAGTFGWWSREFDMFIWCTVRATGDLPPIVENMTVLRHTLSTAARTVSFNAFDCNPSIPADTGVVSAGVWYSVDGGTPTFVAATLTTGTWSADIPGQAAGSSVTYYATATDLHNNIGQSTSSPTYRVVDLDRDNYTTTFPTYSFVDITGGGGGTEIQGSDWIPASRAEDDGTAGPFDLGGSYNFFGANFTHAWVGVNGGLALVASTTDTVYVRNGSFSGEVPPAADVRDFIGAFWNDLYASPGGHGSVWYRASGSTFIVQWNRIGNFNSAADTTTTFEIILDRSDTSITYQYADVGNTGLELSGASGIQGGTPGSVTGWVFLNEEGYPTQTRPAAGLAIKMKSLGPTGVGDPGEGLPARFALHANYPNPFNPSTSISYDVPNASQVELTVYNLLGEKIAELVNGEKAPGTYSATWDGRNLTGQTVSSGVYLYRLKAGSFLQTRKMVLLK